MKLVVRHPECVTVEDARRPVPGISPRLKLMKMTIEYTDPDGKEHSYEVVGLPRRLK